MEKEQFDVVKAIEERKSVRTYDAQRNLSEQQLYAIQHYIENLSNPFDENDIKITFVDKQTDANGEKLGTYGIIKGASTFLALAVSNQPQTWVAAGYEFEDLILYITSLGLGTVWIGGTFRRSAFSHAINLPNDMLLPVVCPVGYAEKPRLTERLMRRMVKCDSRKPWSEMFFDGSTATPLTQETAGKFAQPLEMLRLAPSATNSQPWRVIKEDNQWNFYVEFKPNITETERIMKHLDIGIAICHFDLTRKALGLEGHWFVDRPSIDVPDNYHYIATFI